MFYLIFFISSFLFFRTVGSQVRQQQSYTLGPSNASDFAGILYLGALLSISPENVYGESYYYDLI